MNEKEFELLLARIKQAGASNRALRLPKFQQELESRQLIESVELYAKIYAEDEEL